MRKIRDRGDAARSAWRSAVLPALLALAASTAVQAATTASMGGVLLPDETAAETAWLRKLIPPAPVVHPALAEDERLHKPVTVAVWGRPISELLAELSRSSGIPLSATTDVADDEVSVGFSGRPLAQVLTLLSTHFGFTWRQDYGGYKLWQDFASKQREVNSRKQEVQGLLDDLLRSGRLAGQPAEAIQARIKSLEDVLSVRGGDPAERAPLIRELQDLRRVAHPTGRLALSLLSRAPVERIRKLFVDGKERFSTTTGDISENDALRWQVESQISGRDRFGMAAPGKAGDPLSIAILYHLDAGSTSHSGHATMRVAIIRKAIRRNPRASFVYAVDYPRTGPLPLLNDKRLEREITELRPAFSRMAGFDSGSQLYLWRQTIRRAADRMPRLSEILRATHRETGIDVLSDNLVGAEAFPNLYRKGARFDYFLHATARNTGLGMQIYDGVLRVRSVNHHNLRERQVPARLMQQTAAELQPDAQNLLTTLFDLVGRLHPGQRFTLVREWDRLWANDRIFVPTSAYDLSQGGFLLLDLLAQLSPQMRSRLMTGEEVPVRDFAPRDRDAVDSALAAAADAGRDLPPFAPTPGSAGPPASLAFKTFPQDVTVYGRYKNDILWDVETQYGPVGRTMPPPAAAEGKPPYVLVGAPYSEFAYLFILRDAENRLAMPLGSLVLRPPALFPRNEADP